MEPFPTEFTETAPTPRYLFIVARERPDILARMRERFANDLRIEVLLDRRHGERRASVIARVPERRGSDRRRPTKLVNNLSVYPVVVAQKRVASYAELAAQVAALSRECEVLRTQRDKLDRVIADLHRDLNRLATALSAATEAVGRLRQQADTDGGPPRVEHAR